MCVDILIGSKTILTNVARYVFIYIIYTPMLDRPKPGGTHIQIPLVLLVVSMALVQDSGLIDTFIWGNHKISLQSGGWGGGVGKSVKKVSFLVVHFFFCWRHCNLPRQDALSSQTCLEGFAPGVSMTLEQLGHLPKMRVPSGKGLTSGRRLLCLAFRRSPALSTGAPYQKLGLSVVFLPVDMAPCAPLGSTSWPKI